MVDDPKGDPCAPGWTPHPPAGEAEMWERLTPRINWAVHYEQVYREAPVRYTGLVS